MKSQGFSIGDHQSCRCLPSGIIFIGVVALIIGAAVLIAKFM